MDSVAGAGQARGLRAVVGAVVYSQRAGERFFTGRRERHADRAALLAVERRSAGRG